MTRTAEGSLHGLGPLEPTVRTRAVSQAPTGWSGMRRLAWRTGMTGRVSHGIRSGLSPVGLTKT